MKLKSTLLAAAAVFVSTQAWSADTITHIPVEPEPLRPSHGVAVNNWSGLYVRGDIGYVISDFRGADFILYGKPGYPGSFNSYSVDDSWTLGGGIGYQINQYLRTDVTLDYMFNADFTGSTSGFCSTGAVCVSTDTSNLSAYVLMANAYVDFWSYGNFTAYVGGGIGGTYVKWDDLTNTSCLVSDPNNCPDVVVHGGNSEWRFTAAVMAGGAYHFRCDLAADVGYRYRWIAGGEMFKYASFGGPGYDNDFNTHEVRAGLRYYPGRDCSPPVIPEPPLYK